VPASREQATDAGRRIEPSVTALGALMARYAVRSLPAYLRAIDRVTSRRYKRDATACTSASLHAVPAPKASHAAFRAMGRGLNRGAACGIQYSVATRFYQLDRKSFVGLAASL
jgi:hypothetical protein